MHLNREANTNPTHEHECQYNQLVGRGSARASIMRPKQIRRTHESHIDPTHAQGSRDTVGSSVGRGSDLPVLKTDFLGTRKKQSITNTRRLSREAKVNPKTQIRAFYGVPLKENWSQS